MATTKLSLYNGALRIVGERKTTLTENREPRRLLDDAWDEHAHDSWLEEASWRFALVTVKIQYDTGIEPDFGYQRAYTKPTDMVRLVGIWRDEYLTNPIRDYTDEGELLYGEDDEVFVSYVSNDNTRGGDMGVWPKSFARFVEAFLANEIAPRIKNDKAVDAATKHLELMRRNAKNKDAMKSPTRKPVTGAWAGSRSANRRYRHGYPT